MHVTGMIKTKSALLGEQQKAGNIGKSLDDILQNQPSSAMHSPQLGPARSSTPSRRPSTSTKPNTNAIQAPPALNAYGVPINFAKASISDKENNAKSMDFSFTAAISAGSGGTSGNEDGNTAERIRVCVRKRPLSSKEISKSEKDIAEVLNPKTVVVHEPK